MTEHNRLDSRLNRLALRRMFLIAAMTTLAAGTRLATAGSFVWDADGDASAALGGSGEWDNTTLLWRASSDTGTLSAWPNGAGSAADQVIFGGTAGTVSMNGLLTDINVNRLTFQSDGYVIDQPIAAPLPGDPVAKLVLSGTTPTVDTGAFTATIKATTAGSITKEGTGTLILSGTVLNVGGNHVINAGTLRVAKEFGGTGNNGLNGSVTIRSSGTLQLANSTNVDELHDGTNLWMRGGTFDINGAVSAGVFEKVGQVVGFGTITNSSTTAAGLRLGGFSRESFFTGTISDGASPMGIRLSDGNSVTTLSGNNTYSGGTFLDAGGAGSLLNIASVNAIGTGPLTVLTSGARFDNTTGTALTLPGNNSLILQNGDPKFVGSSDLSLGSGRIDMTLSGANRRAVTVLAGKLTVAGLDYAGATSPHPQFTKQGAGTLEIKGATPGTHTGIFSLGGGTVIVDTTLMGATPTNPVTTGQMQIAGTLRITGGGTTNQTFSSLAARIGDSTLQVDSAAGGSTTVTLTALQRQQTGATLNFILPASGGVVTPTATPSGGVFGWATVDDNTFAVSAGNGTVAGAISGLPTASYNAGFATATNVDAPTGPSDVTATGLNVSAVNTIRFNHLGVASVSHDALVVTAGGVLVTSNVGANDVSITGPSLTSGTSDLILIQNNPAGSLAISSIITDNGASSRVLTKSGEGTVVLSNAANTYTGKTYLNNGVLQIVAEGSLGPTPAAAVTDQIRFNGGTLTLDAAIDLSANRGITIDAGGGTIDTNGFNSTYGGIIATGFAPGDFTKAGTGNLTLTGVNSNTLGYNVKGGSLTVTGGANVINDNAPVTIDGGTFTVNANEVVGPVRLISGTINGTANLKAGDYDLRSGTVDAVLDDTNLTGGTINGVSIIKSTTGIVTLNNANSVRGGVFINGGVLVVNNAGAIGSSGAVVFDGGTLRYTANNAVDYSGRFLPIDAQPIRVDTNGQNVTYATAITGMGTSITKTGTGTLTLTAANTFSGGTIVEGGTLRLGANARAAVLDGTSYADVKSGGRLEIDYTGSTTVVSSVLDALKNAKAANLSTGPIRSSTATAALGLGWIDDISTSTLTLIPTLYGDFNLDFTVNFSDLLALAANYGLAGTWSQGDSNYDGTVNFSDLLALAANYGQVTSASGTFEGDWALAQSLVPEPTTTAAMLGATSLALTRRRRS
ncbi:MAG: autotransporter-associated beta strand repeat-containing protein [Tepidisphaeraceae bacterium]